MVVQVARAKQSKRYNIFLIQNIDVNLELKIISNSVSIPQIMQDYAPLWQEGSIAVFALFPQRFGENLEQSWN